MRVFTREEKHIDVAIVELIIGSKISESDSKFISALIEKINPKIKIITAESILDI